MNKITFRLPTAVALLINLVGMGLAPLPSAAAPATERPDIENGASFGVLPGWFSTTSDHPIQATDEATFTDNRGQYTFEGLPHGTHKVTIDASTLPPDLLPDEGESVPVLWLTPGQSQTSEALSTGVRFTATYDRESGAIAGMVFLDRDDDGQRGTGELGIAGVRVVDPTIHQYFVPFDDQDLWTLFEEKAQCHGETIAQPLISFVFVIAGSDGTIYYYDHWEDGYDADPLNPGPTTEVAMVDAGVSEIFQSDIDPAQVGGGPPFYYDGRDRISVFGEDAAVVRLVYPETPGMVLAGAWEVAEAAAWGTGYVATVGEDLVYPDNPNADDHDYSGLEVMAWQDGTDLYFRGSLAATLGAGEVFFVDGGNDGAGGGGVDSDDVITATAPIQVQMMTGACAARWSAHGYTLQPVDTWYTAYWAPVPGFADDPAFCSIESVSDVDTDIYLHNPHSYVITVTVSSDVGTFDIPVPAATTVSVLDETGWADVSTRNYAVRLSSSETFWGISVVDSATDGASDASLYDWGYVLVPEPELSSQVVMGYAPGNGLLPPTDNGNMAFVAAVTDTVIYVDLNQDGLPDPIDMNGDGDRDDDDAWGEAAWDEPLSALGIPLQAGQVLRVGDPYDRDLTGALIYTTNLLDKIIAAWGEDPCPADINNPYLDLGYTVLPVPIPRLSKVDELAIDADLSGGVSPGDTITYSLVLHNNGLGSMNDVVLTDTLPYTYTDLVVNSLRISTPPPIDTVDYYDGVSWGTDPITDAHMLRVTWDTVGPGQTVTISFRVMLDTMIPVTVTQITNQAVVDAIEIRATQSEDPEDPIDPPTDTPVDRPLLSIDKRVSPAIVRPGGRITYTVVVSNYGNGVALLTTITDVLPSWIEYVPGTLDLTWPIAHVEVTTRAITHTSAFHGYYADDFDLTVTQTTLYTGNDGSLAWSGGWLEVNDLVPLGPSTGDVQVGTVVTDALSVPAYLTMTNGDVGIRRTADLADFRGPLLRYYVAGETNAADEEYVAEAGTVSLSEQYSGDYILRELDLSAIAGTLATVHYTATDTLDPDDHYRFDNIAIYETDPERSGVQVLTWEHTVLSYTTSTGGDPVSYNPLTGHIVFTNGRRLPSGGFITITFQAQVAIPLTDDLTLTNTACVTSLNWLDPLSPPCDEASVQVVSSHTLTVAKTADPTAVEAGGLLTYTIDYTIAGDEAVTSVVISDTTPQHTTFYTATPVPDSHPGVGGTGPVIWRMSGLWPPGSGITQSFGTVTLVVLVDSALISGTTVFNSVIVTDTTGLTATGTTTTPVNVIADVSVLKTDSHDPVSADWILTYTLTVHNAGPSDAQDVAVTDTLPVEVTFLDATPPNNYSPPPDHFIVWDLGTLAAGETRPLTIVVQVQSWVTDTFTNTVVVATSTPESNYGNNTATEPTGVGKVTDVTIGKTDDVDPVVPGNPLVYTLVYTNNGPSDAENVVVSDTLPVEVIFEDADPVQASGPNPLVWNLGTVVAGTGGTIRVTVTVQSWVTQTFTNPVSIATSSPESNYGNNVDTEPTGVIPVADVTIAKSDDVDPVVPGNPLVYTLVYANNGLLDAENVVVSDTLPVEVIFEDADPVQASGPNPLVWNLGTVAAGTGGTIRVTVTVQSWVTQTFTNPVSISTSTPESNYGNNTATEPTDVLEVADVAIAKSDDVDPVVPGDPLVYTLVYTNNGPLDAENVVVSDTLPVEVIFEDADPVQALGPNPLVWNLGTVAAGTGGTIRVTVTVQSWVTQTFTNPVSISTSTPESNYGNNVDTEPTTPLMPGLTMVKMVEPCRVVPNMPFTYTIRITNTGGLTLTTLVLTDTLPPDFNYVVGSGQPTDPDVLAEPTLVWRNLGPLAPAETLNVSFAVTVTPGVTGSFVNAVVVSSTHPIGVITGTSEVSICVEMPAVALDKRVTRWDRNSDVITFSIAITNVGPSTLDIIPLMDDYDFRFLSFSDAVPEPDEGDDDGLLSWYDLTGPPPNGFDRNLIPGARFVVTTVFNVVGDFTSTVNTAIISGVVDTYNNRTGEITDSVEIINIPTGIELLDLQATGHESGVLVEWTTLIEVDAYGFWIYRALLDRFDQASQIAFQPKEGNLVGARYTYLDKDVTLGQQYWYWLVGLSNEGHRTRYGPVSATAGVVSVGQHRTYLPIVIRSK